MKLMRRHPGLNSASVHVSSMVLSSGETPRLNLKRLYLRDLLETSSTLPARECAEEAEVEEAADRATSNSAKVLPGSSVLHRPIHGSACGGNCTLNCQGACRDGSPASLNLAAAEALAALGSVVAQKLATMQAMDEAQPLAMEQSHKWPPKACPASERKSRCQRSLCCKWVGTLLPMPRSPCNCQHLHAQAQCWHHTCLPCTWPP